VGQGMSAQLPADPLILAAALLLVGGVLGAGFADRLRIPGLLLFLALGMLIGDDGLALLRLNDPRWAQIGGAIALALILYEGGLTTKPGDIRRAALPAGLLATVGVMVTAALVAAGAHVLLDVPLATSMLIGAVVASTDAAAIFTVLRRTPMHRRLVAVLEVESGTNDPMAIVLTLGLLEWWTAGATTAALVAFGVLQLAGGVLVGVAMGVVGSWVLNRAELGTEGLYPVLALAVGGLGYGVAAFAGASGFLSVYVTGLLVGARVPRHRRSIRAFHDGLGNTAEIGLFLLLGVLVFPSQLPAVLLPALGIVAVLVLVARPAAVALCLAPLRYEPREMVLLSWAGLRGAVPIVLASLPFTAAYPDGELIFDVVFFVVLVSAAVQGGTVRWLASRLDLVQPGRAWAPVAEALPLDGVDAELIEVHITPDLFVAGKRIRDVPLPAGALLTVVLRGERTLIPTGSTRLEAGDLAVVAMPNRPTATRDIVAWARGELPAR
jgi:potassium/hydrogen antiporter